MADTSPPTALDLIPGSLRCLLGASQPEDGLQAALGHLRGELGLSFLAIGPGTGEAGPIRSGPEPDHDWARLGRLAAGEAAHGQFHPLPPAAASANAPESGWAVLPLRHPAGSFLLLQPTDAAPSPAELHTLAEVLLLLYEHRRQSAAQTGSAPGVLEQSNEVVLITGPAPGFETLYVNPAFTRMTGYEPEEILGRNPKMLQGPKTERRVINRIRKALQQGEGITARAHNYRKDGSHYLLQWSISPIRDANGKVVQWFSFQRDVTAELERQAAIVQQERSLTRRLDEHETAFRQELAGKVDGQLGRQLTLLKLQHEHLRAMCRRLPAGLRDSLWQELSKASESVDDAVRQVGSLARQLAPSQLTTKGLGPALSEYLTDVQAKTDYRIHFSHEGKLNELPQDVSQILYRLVQDAVRLGLAYTQTADLSLRIVVRNKRVELRFVLQAANFPPPSLATHPLLMALEDRLAFVGADYNLSTRPKESLVMQATLLRGLPLPPGPPSDDLEER